MAIILITGLPGHGKTLYTIARFRDQASKDGRQIYQSGIKGLKLPWIEHAPEKWEELPPKSIFIIDEAQFKFPLRGKGSPAEWIERLAVHRHAGIDFVLITQNPMLIDSFVRRLIDQHFHVVRKFGTKLATIHEYPTGVHDQVAKSRGDSIRHEWRYPKDVFELYTSAEVHTVKSRIPMRVWLLLAIPFIIAALVFIAYQRMKPEAVGARIAIAGGAASAPAGGTGAIRGGSGNSQQVGPLSPEAYMALHRPRVAGLAYTAPVYDAVTVPVRAPVPAACVASASRCKCYSQQATLLDVAEDMCRQIAGGGYFRAFDNAPEAGSAASALPGASAPGQPVVKDLPSEAPSFLPSGKAVQRLPSAAAAAAPLALVG